MYSKVKLGNKKNTKARFQIGMPFGYKFGMTGSLKKSQKERNFRFGEDCAKYPTKARLLPAVLDFCARFIEDRSS